MLILIIVIIIIIIIIICVVKYKESFTNVPVILHISCYGYGNMGDNMYKEVFNRFIPEYKIISISDHSLFVDRKHQIIRNIPKDDLKFDYLLFGGGGLLLADKLQKSKNILHYFNLAKKYNAPLLVVSCGIQGNITNFNNTFKDWKDFIDYASLITVRSPTDKQLLYDYMIHHNIGNVEKLHYFRDLGYIYPRIVPKVRTNDKYITLIIAGPIHDKNEELLRQIQNKPNKIIIMNMGSIYDDDNNNRIMQMNIPNTIRKYYGSGKAKELTTKNTVILNQKKMEEYLHHNRNDLNPSDLDLQTVIHIIYNSEKVYTGRYHGMIFSRSLGIPYSTMGMGTNKVLWEEPDSSDTYENSLKNIEYLRKYLNLKNVDLRI